MQETEEEEEEEAKSQENQTIGEWQTASLYFDSDTFIHITEDWYLLQFGFSFLPIDTPYLQTN